MNTGNQAGILVNFTLLAGEQGYLSTSKCPDHPGKLDMQCSGRAGGDTQTAAITGLGIQPQGIVIQYPGLCRTAVHTGLAVRLFKKRVYTGVGIDFRQMKLLLDSLQEIRFIAVHGTLHRSSRYCFSV